MHRKTFCLPRGKFPTIPEFFPAIFLFPQPEFSHHAGIFRLCSRCLASIFSPCPCNLMCDCACTMSKAILGNYGIKFWNSFNSLLVQMVHAPKRVFFYMWVSHNSGHSTSASTWSVIARQTNCLSLKANCSNHVQKNYCATNSDSPMVELGFCPFDHIVQILNCVAWPEVFSMSHT